MHAFLKIPLKEICHRGPKGKLNRSLNSMLPPLPSLTSNLPIWKKDFEECSLQPISMQMDLASRANATSHMEFCFLGLRDNEGGSDAKGHFGRLRPGVFAKTCCFKLLFVPESKPSPAQPSHQTRHFTSATGARK